MKGVKSGLLITTTLIFIMGIATMSLAIDDADAKSFVEYSDINSSDFYNIIASDIVGKTETEYNLDSSLFTSTNTIVPSSLIAALYDNEVLLKFNVYSNDTIEYIYVIDSSIKNIESSDYIDYIIDLNLSFSLSGNDDSVILNMEGEGIQPFETILYLNLESLSDDSTSESNYTMALDSTDISTLTIGDTDYLVLKLDEAKTYTFDISEQFGSVYSEDSKLERILISMAVTTTFIIGILLVFRYY